ncbi:plasmid partitioning protein [Methylobacterium variabile]|jgi:ParB family chromosome partitioning protein|uniref:Plasmid partitioning protein n=1 Tax=Methylobacterium variabile TaxID=298794 RepID=A0A0J6SIE6_9HYPH|nr:plasmid partitioning protein RepB [Methylobacterium variabile]KMO33454.1 plasmid partitioning protein [Methylobacterium variabile]
MSKSKSIRDLMARRVPEAAPEAAPPTESTASPPLSGDNAPPAARRAGAARSFGAMWQEREQARVVADAERDGAIVELDPDLCDPSAIADRVPDSTDAAFDAFVEQIREEGQRSPALVRPKPGAPGRYEIAYGRRRRRAAQLLGRPLRAIVRALSDTELLIAQGSENLARADLSYIERAHFAHNMMQAGVARDVIAKAMGTQNSNLSSYLAVAEGIPGPALATIGPAPGVGRPRWLTLADRIKAATGEQVEAALASPDLAGKTSDERFAVVLAALNAAPPPKRKPKAETVKDAKGLKFARVERSAVGVRVTTDEASVPGFGDYLAERLPELLAAYRQSKG